MHSETSQTEIIEISLRDVIDFLVRYWKLIALWGLFGLSMATAYLLLTPRKFEAHWQVQMAQFISNATTNSIEESASVVQRLRIPTVYPAEVSISCGIPEGQEFGDYLDGALKAEPIKNLNNIIDLKVSAASSSQAKECAESITNMIAAQQKALIAERLAGSQEQLNQYKNRLKEELQELEKLKSPETGSLGYLVKFDSLSWLRTRIDALQEVVQKSQLRPTKLTAPIHAPNKPVARKSIFKLTLGIAFGLMLGLLNAILVKVWRGRKQGD